MMNAGVSIMSSHSHGNLRRLPFPRFPKPKPVRVALPVMGSMEDCPQVKWNLVTPELHRAAAMMVHVINGEPFAGEGKRPSFTRRVRHALGQLTRYDRH
jgi:hypothetical protein